MYRIPGNRQYFEYISQGDLDIPCVLLYLAVEKMKKLERLLAGASKTTPGSVYKDQVPSEFEDWSVSMLMDQPLSTCNDQTLHQKRK